jgi:hypothetical protein
MTTRAYRVRRDTEGRFENWCPLCLTTASIHGRRTHECSGRETCGPGCQLRRTFAWFGLKDDGSCGCDEFAAKMDAWGPACWQHMEEIVDHLREAAAKRGLPFLATAARIAVARAIEAGTPPAG